MLGGLSPLGLATRSQAPTSARKVLKGAPHMSVHSVPCWFFLDKQGATLASNCFPVGFPLPSRLVFILPLDHDDHRIRSAWRSTSTRLALVKQDNPPLRRTVGSSHLKSLPFLTLVISIPSSTEALTFGRSGAHFREKYVLILAHTQVEIQVKRVRNVAFAAIILSAGRGAHFQEKGCSLSGEPLLTFGRSGAHFREK
jgi:hypothetical protein